MGNRKIKINLDDSIQTEMQTNSIKSNAMTMQKFFDLHEKFMDDKSLQGLTSRTLYEHRYHMKIFKKYLEQAYRSELDHIAVDVDVFKTYLYWMVHEKQYKPCTVNIRLRTLKCYLKWLYEEKYLHSNYALKLKLLKTPLDTVHPLTKQEVKKLLKACDLTTYAGFRDYTAMLTILDCGIRSSELVELMIPDIDLQQELINVRCYTAQ